MWKQTVGKSLKELRFVFCQTNQQSQGSRKFVYDNYMGVKQNFPDFPMIVRECEGVQPYIIARYNFGVEKKALISNLDQKEIEDVVNSLVKQAAQVNQQIQK